MVAKVVNFPAATPHESAANLRVVEDEFSAKVSADGDNRFWIRVERSAGDTIVVSDLILGGLAESDLLAGLKLALRTLQMGGRSRILFKDLVPGGAGKPLFGFRLEQMTESVKRISQDLAAETGRKVVEVRIQPRGEKMDAAVYLAGTTKL